MVGARRDAVKKFVLVLCIVAEPLGQLGADELDRALNQRCLPPFRVSQEARQLIGRSDVPKLHERGDRTHGDNEKGEKSRYGRHEFRVHQAIFSLGRPEPFDHWLRARCKENHEVNVRQRLETCQFALVRDGARPRIGVRIRANPALEDNLSASGGMDELTRSTSHHEIRWDHAWRITCFRQ